MSYTIRLADGTEIKDLTLNGTTYVSKVEVDETIFENNTELVTIIDEDGVELTLHNVEFIQRTEYEGEYYLSFCEKGEFDVALDDIRSQLDYIAMMTDVEI